MKGKFFCKKFYLLIFAGLFFLSFFLKNVQAQILQDGDLVRTRDNPALYLIQNGQKRVFPHASVYHSWGLPKDFSTVKVVSDLSSYPEGEPVSFRDGSLFRGKTTSLYGHQSSAVFFVSNGRLRPVKSAEIYQKLFNDSKWKKVAWIPDDLLDKFAYPIAEMIDTAGIHPDGSLVRYKGTAGIYLIENNKKRPITSIEIFNDNRLNLAEVIEIEPSETYETGSAVQSEEEKLTLNIPKIEEEIEILKDTKFEWGFTNKFPHSNLPENKRCKMPVQGKEPIWRTAEIATETHFCNDLPNPKSTNPIIFESKSGYKKLYSYRDGRIKLQLDSSVEENQGCRITNNITPESNWIHYGVVQYMSVDFADFEELNFNADIKLNKFKPKISSQDCTKYGAPVEKYGEFVIVFLLQRKDGSDSPSNLFWLLLAPCSKHWWPGAGGENIPCTSNLREYIQRDQFGIVIYHPPMGNEHPILKEGGQWATYSFDLKKLAKDAVSYHNSQYDPDINLYDYNLVHVNLGWEIMGAFETEIELKNLSLIGRCAIEQ